MATRRETQDRRAALVRDVLEAQRTRSWAGGIAPSQRELSARYGLSLRTVSLELRKLARDGLVSVKPRVGTFSNAAIDEQGSARTFGVVLPYPLSKNVHLALAHYGFETRIAERGAACLSFSSQAWNQKHAEGKRQFDGVFVFEAARFKEHELDCAHLVGDNMVIYDPDDVSPQVRCAHDRVGIDNFDGGLVATRRLLECGHRRIAFLGLHHSSHDSLFVWSRVRQDGWRQALNEAGVDIKGLTFAPKSSSSFQDQMERGRHASLKLLPHLRAGEVSAVVTANSITTAALLEVIRSSALDITLWPAIVSFDDELPDADAPVVSALRLPWETIGREAADLLWERATGRLSGPPVCRLAKMMFIPRLTCGTRPSSLLNSPVP